MAMIHYVHTIVVGVVLVLGGAFPALAQSPDCSAAAAYNRAQGGVTFLVLRDGEVVCRDYVGEASSRSYFLASGTKSFTGVMAAAAAQDGLLVLDELVSDTITEWKTDPRRSRITIRQLLSLTSGISAGENGAPPSYSEAIQYPSVADPGTMFDYGPVPFQIFGEVMRRKLIASGRPGDPLIYFKVRVLDALGIAPALWRRDEEGYPNMPSGASLTAAQWAAYGEFIRLGGRDTEAHQLVDSATLEALFVGSTTNPGYGVGWWLPGRAGLVSSRGETSEGPTGNAGATGADTIMAAGAGKQRLFVIRSRDLTVVRQTEGRDARRSARRQAPEETGDRWSDETFLTLLLNGL